MRVDEGEPGRIDVDLADSCLRLGFTDSSWRICFPPAWQRVPSEDEDLWCWEAPDAVAARVRLRRHPRVQLEVDLLNPGTEVAALETPTVSLSAAGALVPWFAGSAGEVVVALPDATVEWTQRRGSCSGHPGAFTLFPEPLVLRGGQAASAAWRRRVLPAATIVAAPPFVPRRRYLPVGEPLAVEHTDAGLLGPSLDVVTTMEGSEVLGAAGLHTLSFLDARGTALVEVGWFDTLESLAAAALGSDDLAPGLAAWLLCAAPGGIHDLDALDVTLGEALEDPDVWAVLAGMRAATATDLPVATEVRSAAQHLWRGDLDESARRLLVTHALLAGWEPELVDQWLRSGAPVTTVDATQALAGIGMGRITSEPVAWGGRDVVLAHLWVLAHGESATAAEWEGAVDTARARLLCHLSQHPVPLDVAWLLAGEMLG